MVERLRLTKLAESVPVEIDDVVDGRHRHHAINIRGTNGAGKSTLVRKLMDAATTSPVVPEGGKRPEAYRLSMSGIDAPIFVIGPYVAECGGCDAVPSIDETIALLDRYAPQGHVVFEGMLISTTFGAVGDWLAQRGGTMCFLSTPITQCLDNLEDRHKKAGSSWHVELGNIHKKWQRIDKLKNRERSAGRVKVAEIDPMADGALGALIDLLKAPVPQPILTLPNKNILPALIPNRIDFDSAVAEAKEIIKRQATDQLRLGELADRVEVKYGRGDLKKFADEIGVADCTVKRWRDTYRAWPIGAPGRDLPYAVLRELITLPDRCEIASKNPDLTKSQAADIRRAYNERHGIEERPQGPPRPAQNSRKLVSGPSRLRRRQDWRPTFELSPVTRPDALVAAVEGGSDGIRISARPPQGAADGCRGLRRRPRTRGRLVGDAALKNGPASILVGQRVEPCLWM